MTFRTIAAARAEELGAVLHLPLDDESGTTARATIGSDGTYSGGPTLGVAGPSVYLPAGISTDGSNDYVAAGAAVTLGSSQPQTLEWWSNNASSVSTNGTRQNAVSGSGGFAVGFGQFFGGVADETVHLSDGSNGTYWEGGFTVTSGWHHHAFAFDGSAGGWTYYLDGAATGIRESGGGGAAGFASWAPEIGRRGAEYTAWDGFAAFTVYDRELTAAEVYENYRLGLDLAVGTALSPVSY